MDRWVDRCCAFLLITCRLPQVTATNHVSALTEDFNVTVDRLQPMANLSVRGVPDVVPQGSTQTLTTSVLLDMSVAATVRCERGRGQACRGLAASVEVWEASTGLMCSSSFLRCEMRQEEGWREDEGGAKPPD